MIVRTPPPQRKRRVESSPEVEEDRRIVIYKDPALAPIVTSPRQPPPDHGMVCTFQCLQMVKSEFMDAYHNAEKQLVNYQSKLNTLTNDLYNSKEENNKLQEKIYFFEQELAATKGREKALEERLLKEVDESLESYRSQVKRNSELEIQLKKEVDLRRSAEASATAAKENSESLEQKVAQLSERLEKERRHLLKELADSEDEAKLKCSRLNKELERIRMRADCALEESELQQKQLDELRGQLNEVLKANSLLEQQLSNSTGISHQSTPSEDQALVKLLQNTLRDYECEVQEARKLRSIHEDINLLKEKLLDEKIRRERAEEQLLQLQETDLHASKINNELAALKSLVNDIPGIISFEEIPKKVAALQQETIDILKKFGEANEHVKSLEVALESTNLAKKESETECALAKEKVEALTLEVNHLKRSLRFVTEERDTLKRDVLTTNKQQKTEKDGEESIAKIMESAIAEKDCCIQELEGNLQEQREIINHKHEELRLANEKLNFEMKRVKSLEREGERLRSEISLLESKLGHGDYSSANTKVLRMVNTLTVDNEAKLTIEALHAELQKTQAKLQALEELKGHSDAGNLIDGDISEKLAQLKSQIATLEKREERYKTVFADKISVFRKACCSLFGYKIIMDDQQRPNGIPVTRFTLQSIYAQTDEEKLEFEYESGNTNILVNDYVSQQEISHQVDIFIRKLNSIPAFTANLTVESFNKRTIS